MHHETINIDAFPYLLHPDLASYPDALATDGPLITLSTFDAQTFVERFPPIIATINGCNYVVGMRLSLHVNLRVLGRATFKVEIRSPECSSDADVAGIAKGDCLVYDTLIAQLTPSYVSRPTEIRVKHIEAGQICPVCEVYERGSVKPLITPLSSAQNWRGVLKKDQGGKVCCRRCKFRVQLDAEEFRKFIEFRLPTARYITAELVDGQPVYCPDCEKNSRRGLLLRRQFVDRIVSRCPFCRNNIQIISHTSETPCPISTSSLNSPGAPASAV